MKPNEREMELANEYYDSIDCMDRGQIAEMFAAYRRELAPKWTREVPTVAGVYWCRTRYGGAPDMEQITSVDGALVVASVLRGDCGPSEVTAFSSTLHAEWAGPLPEPEE